MRSSTDHIDLYRVAGAVSGDQVRTNAAALRWEPTEADLVELDEITAGQFGCR